MRTFTSAYEMGPSGSFTDPMFVKSHAFYPYQFSSVRHIIDVIGVGVSKFDELRALEPDREVPHDFAVGDVLVLCFVAPKSKQINVGIGCRAVDNSNLSFTILFKIFVFESISFFIRLFKLYYFELGQFNCKIR